MATGFQRGTVEEGKATAQKAAARAKEIMGKNKKPKIDLEEDAASVEPTNDQLLGVYKMCEYVKATQAKLELLYKQVKEQEDHLLKLLEVDIPEAMKSIGLLSVKLADGSTLEVKTSNHASYKASDEGKIFDWLRKNGHSDIIKNVIAVAFAKGQDAKAEALAKFLNAKKYEGWEQKQTIHAGTFKAFVREQLEAGKKLPKVIAIFPKSEAIIKEPKNGNQSKTSTRTSSKEDKF